MVKFPNEKEEKQVSSYGMSKVYELEDMGIIRNEPIKVNEEMQMCAIPNLEKIEEWPDNRTVNGNKLTKKQGETIDQFVYFLFVAIQQNNDERINIFLKRMDNPQFRKWKDKQAGKYHRKFSALALMEQMQN